MTDVQARLEKLSETKAKVLARVHALPPDKIGNAPDRHSFSPAELVDHLAKTEEWYVEQIAESHVGDAATPSHRWLYRMVLSQMRKAKKMKVVPSMFIPSEHVALDQAEKHWEGAHATFRQALWECSTDQVVYHHKLFGNMSAGMILDMMEAHHHYHDVHSPV